MKFQIGLKTGNVPRTAPDAARPDSGGSVFISYSHRDQDFVRRLHQALEEQGRDCWVDYEGIAPSAKWLEVVHSAIDAADAFVFVISPDSVSSKICRDELAHAARANKRILPIVRRDARSDATPEAAAERHWLFFRESDDFEDSLGDLTAALDTDPVWARTHTRLLVRAREWEQASRNRGFVLRGQDLQAAERWLTETDERKDPQPTRLQAEYVLASRQAATRAQRIRFAALAVALVVVAGLGVVALVQRNRAEERARVARSRELASAAQLELSSNPDAALVLAVEANEVSPTAEAEVALRQGLAEPHPSVVFRGHERTVYSAEYSSDGGRLVTASADGTARIWSPQDGQLMRTIRPKPGIVTSAAFSRDGRRLVTTTGHGAIDIWDPSTGRRLASPQAPPGKIRTAAFSRDGALLVTGGDDGAVRLWDPRTAEQINRFDVPRGRVSDASFSPDGGQLMAVGGDQAARTWNLQTGRAGPTLQTSLEAGEMNSAAFSPDGREVVTTSEGGTGRIWHLRSGRVVGLMRVPGHEMRDASFSRDGGRVVTASFDGAARVWDWHAAARDQITGDPSLIGEFRGPGGDLFAASFSPDGRQVVAAGSDGKARSWTVATDRPVATYTPDEGDLLDAAFSPHGARIATASSYGKLDVWSSDTKRKIQVFNPIGYPVRTAAFSPDGRELISGGPGRTASVWDIATGEQLQVLRDRDANILGATFSPDGRMAATANQDRRVRLWDLASGDEAALLCCHEKNYVYSVAFSPDGRSLVSAGNDGTARLWDIGTARPVRVWNGPTDNVYSAAFSPDGDRIVTANGDGTARVWDTASGETVAVLRGHTDGVLDAAFSPDGELIATSSSDRDARVWDADSGESLDVLTGHSDYVNSIAFSPDGNRIVTASYDNTAAIFVCGLCRPLDELLDLARQELAPAVTPEERAAYLSEGGGDG